MSAMCSICGRPGTENAHIVSKGMGGDPAKLRTDTAPLCAGTGGNTDPSSCHGANHAGQLALRRGPQGDLQYRPGITYTKVLRKRGIQCHDGAWHNAFYEGADPDTIDAVPDDGTDEALGDALYEADKTLDAALARSHAATRDAADALAEGLRVYQRELGERKGRAAWVEWRTRQGLGKGTARDMLLVADWIPHLEARSLDWRQQVQLAKACAVVGTADIADTFDDLLGAATTLSVSDFASEYLAKPDPTPRTKEAVCPVCQHAGPTTEFRPC